MTPTAGSGSDVVEDLPSRRPHSVVAAIGTDWHVEVALDRRRRLGWIGVSGPQASLPSGATPRLRASCEFRPAQRRNSRDRRLAPAALVTALLVMLFEPLFDPVRAVQQELVDQVEAPVSDRRFGVLPVESEDDADDLPAVR
jgi:hypothetical protein